MKYTLFSKNVYEIKNEILREYVNGFEIVGSLKIGDQIQQTDIRFRNVDDYEAYINAIAKDYESEDSIFNGYIYKINTSQFNLVNRSQYGNCFDFKT